jgi:hypothetical protein
MSEYNILIEPVKIMLDKACEAASSLLRESDPGGVDHRFELIEEQYDNTLVLYMKYNGDVAYKKIWNLEGDMDLDDARSILYGSMLVEMIATFGIVSTQAKKVKGG